MADTDSGTKPDPQIKKPRTRRVRPVIWAIGKIKRQLHKREAQKKESNPADQAAKRTATATVWIAGFTVVLALVGGITLFEVIIGGNDTHDLAIAAKKQAAASVAQVSNFAALAMAADTQSKQAIAQTKKMSESLDKTDSIIRQATIQATAANKLAEASGRQVTTADKTFALAAEVDRPWIGFSAVSASPAVTEGKEADVVLYVVNAGRRPARTLEFRASANVFEQFPNDPLYSLSPGESPRPSHSIVVPGGGLGAPFKSRAYPSPIVDRMKSGDITFYIYGSVVYEDLVTGKTHTTKICQFFIPSKGTYGWCPEYNDAN